MASPLVFSVDVGTQSIRACLIDSAGVTVSELVRPYPVPYVSPRKSWAEQDAEYYFSELCAVARELREQSGAEFERVMCMTVTVFRDSYVCLDGEGKPLRKCILWLDQRKVKDPRPLALWRRLLFALCGVGEAVDIQRRTSMCNYIAENEPEVWERTEKFVLLSTYLNFRITRRMADSVASQIGHIPFDYRRRRWDRHGITRCLYDIPDGKLCELVPSGTRLGAVSAECAALSSLPEGLPLIATGSDKGCETLGLGVLGQEQAALSFGTSCTVQLTSPRYFEPTPFMPAYPAIPNDLYNGEVQLWRGYWMLTWFKQNFAEKEMAEAAVLGCSAEDLLNRHLKDVPAGCEGLMVLPHWTPTLTTPGARGAMIGFSDVHTKYHVYRAIIEGLNFGLMEGLENMERRSGQKVKELRLAGGGSRSDEICQITANMFGLPVSRVRTGDASALGGAICAFVARGEYPDYAAAVKGMVHLRDTFYPDMEEHKLYERLYREVYLGYYKTLRPLHRKLRELTGG